MLAVLAGAVIMNVEPSKVIFFSITRYFSNVDTSHEIGKTFTKEKVMKNLFLRFCHKQNMRYSTITFTLNNFFLQTFRF